MKFEPDLIVVYDGCNDIIHRTYPKMIEESVTVVKMDFKKLLKMIKDSKILGSKTICAALTYATKEKFLFKIN